MHYRFFVGIVVILVACVLEFFFASAGLFLNFILASLIVSAFLFIFWELAVLVLIAIFLVQWAPAPSATLIVFAVIPFAAWAFRRIFSLRPAAGIPCMIVCGLAVFYLVGASSFSLSLLGMFFIDIVVSLIFGGLVFAALTQAEK